MKTVALDLDLMTDAYRFAKESYGSGKSTFQLRKEFGSRYDEGNLHAVLMAYERACTLLEAAEDVAEKFKLRLLEEQQSVEFLEQSYGGFSPLIYLDAFHEGLLRHAIRS